MFPISGLVDGTLFMRRRDIESQQERQQQIRQAAQEADRVHRERAKQYKYKAMPTDDQLPSRFRSLRRNVPAFMDRNSNRSKTECGGLEKARERTIKWADD